MATVEERQRLAVKTKMQTPYHLIIRNISRDVSAVTIVNLFRKHTYVKAVMFTGDGATDKEALLELRFADEKEAHAAAEEFEKREDWRWNKGFKAKVNGMKVFKAEQDGLSCRSIWNRLDSCNRPDFLGDSVGDDLDALCPGCMVQLPAWQKRKLDVRVDERFGKESFGHPIIITHNHKNGFANIAFCTTFGGFTSREDFSLKPEKKVRYTEIDSDIGCGARERDLEAGRPCKDELLKFENFHGYYRMHGRTYVEANTYTVELRALTRLEPSVVGGFVPGGYLKLEKPEILLEQIENLGEDFKVQHPTVIIAGDQKQVEKNAPGTKEVTPSPRTSAKAPAQQDLESTSGQVRCSLQ